MAYIIFHQILVPFKTTVKKNKHFTSNIPCYERAEPQTEHVVTLCAHIEWVISFWCVNHIDSLNMRSDCYYSNVYSWKHKWCFSVCTSISLLRKWWLWLLVPSSHCSADSKRQDLWSFYNIKHSFLEISEKCLCSQICDVPPFRITCYILAISLGISHKHFFASFKKKKA